MASFAPIRGTRAQIQATPIVDGQFLVETDQGVDNMIYMDEGSTRTIVGGNTVTGVLPELYIYSETGSVVTVEDAGGTLIPTSQVGTDHWICEVPDYGVYTIYSVLSGDTTTQSVNVTDCMIYTIDDSHFHCNVVVTYPSGVGASCQISGGGETYSAPSLNPPDTSYKFVVHGQNTTYTITTNVDGIIKTETITTGTVLDQTYNVTMPYARVNLTVEMPPITGNIACTDGTTTITRVATPSMSLYLDLGTWTISGSDGIDTYDTEVIVSDLTVTYEADLSSAPDGSTVLPTDDIQIWLRCAKIKDKTSYTTLDDVLNDNETLQKLISSENACNYMVRSKTFINVGLVPQMTSASAPSGNATANSSFSGYEAWKAFNTSETYGWANWGTSPNRAFNSGDWLKYEFPTAQVVRKAHYGWKFASGANDFTFKIQGSNDDFVSDINDLCDEQSNDGFVANTLVYKDIGLDNDTAYKYYRLIITSTSSSNIGYGIKLQYYPQYDEGITEDSIAMRLIGEKNYASDILINNAEWNQAIISSNYLNSISNIVIPTMTSNTTPNTLGEAIADYENPNAQYGGNAFNAMDKNTNTFWHGNGNTVTYPEWLGYKYNQPTKILGASLYPLYYSSTSNTGARVKQYKYQGSNDNFVSDIHDLTEVLTATNASTGVSAAVTGCYVGVENFVAFTKNIDEYTSYRLYIIDSYLPQYAPAVCSLQFYGREDVDETVYNIYSAADDTITVTPQGGGTAITIPTNNDGYGTIAKTNLPNGTYTFVSSKAENPNNLGASDYYSKTITVFNGMIEVAVMPDNTLYWWGYVGGNLEDFTVANGWTPWTSYSLNTPTYNINNIRCYSGSTYYVQGVASKIAISGTVKTIYKGISANQDDYGYIHLYSSKNLTSATDLLSDRLPSSGTHYLETSAVSNGYLVYYAANSREFNIDALWI